MGIAAAVAAAELNKEAFLAQVEEQYDGLRKERDNLSKLYSDSQQQLLEARSLLTVKDEALQSKETSLSNANKERLLQVSKSEATLANQKMQQERTDRIEREADDLREEISTLTEGKAILAAQLAEAETNRRLGIGRNHPDNTTTVHFQLDRVNKELDHVNANNTWLTNELTSKQQDLTNHLTKHSAEMIDLRTKHNNLTAERDENTAHISSLTKQRDDLLQKVQHQGQANHEQKQNIISLQHIHADSIQAEKRLVTAQKEQILRMEQSHTDATRRMESLQIMATQAAQQSQQEKQLAREQIMKESRLALTQQAEQHKGSLQELEEQLLNANRLQQEAEDGLLMASSGTVGQANTRLLMNAETDADTTAITTNGNEDQEPLGLTELYGRLARTEDDLRKERTERRRLELYQQKIMADIQAKAPIFLRQRQEYETALQKEEQSRFRLEDALEEIGVSRTETKETLAECHDLEKKNKELFQENNDLAKQVQALLTRRASGGAAPTDRTSPSSESFPWNSTPGHQEQDDEAIICTTIEEIQNQNQRLLREHRRLTTAMTDLEDKLRQDPVRMELEHTTKELTTLRQDRERQETLVGGIVQQRDLYRALLASTTKQDGVGTMISGEEEFVLAQQQEQHSKITKELQNENTTLQDDLAKISSELSLARMAREAAEERLARYDAHSTELTASVDKLQSELSTSSASVARSEADAEYHRDKCVRLEESLRLARDNVSQTIKTKKELQSVAAEMEQAASVARAQMSSFQHESRQADRKARLAETQWQTAKAAEARMTAEANTLRSELARQGVLLDSVQRIEASLSAKINEEKETLKEDSERISQTLATEQSKHAVQVENLEGRVHELQTSLKLLESKKDEAMSQVIESKKEALGATNEKQMLLSKCTKLEASLLSAKKRLGEEETVDDEEADMQTKIETLTNELEADRQQVEAAKERCNTFQNLAKISENALVDLQKATEEYKKAQTARQSKLQEELQKLKTADVAKQEMVGELTSDLSKQHEEQANKVNELRTKISELQEELRLSQTKSEGATARLDALNSDIASYHADSTMAQNNYERELALHASARTSLRSAREEADTERLLRITVEGQVETLEGEVAEGKKGFEEEKATLEKSLQELDKSLEETRAHNKILHTQLAALGDAMEKNQSEKIASLSGEEESAVEVAQDGADTINSDRKNLSEMREIIRFMRSERDMLQAQVDSARRTAERERANAALTQRSLEEARAEMQVLQSSQGALGDNTNAAAATSDTDNEGKLKAMDDQLNLLRESNKLLRDESINIGKTLESANAALVEVRKSAEPAEQQNRQLQVDKAALAAEKDSLIRETDAWKKRVKGLVSKFNQIDPDEHEEALAGIEKLQEECEQLKTQKRTAKIEITNAKAEVSRSNKELSQQRILVGTQKNAIAKMLLEKQDVTKTKAATKVAALLSKEREQLKEQVQAMTTSAASKATELKGANQRNEVLKTRLRQFLKEINELRLKEKELNLMKAKAKKQAEIVDKSASTAATQKQGEETQAAETEETEIPDVTATELEKEPANEPEKSRATAMEEEKAPEEGNKTLPRVPSGGFKFGPGTTAASASNISIQNPGAETPQRDNTGKAKGATATSVPKNKKSLLGANSRKLPEATQGKLPISKEPVEGVLAKATKKLVEKKVGIDGGGSRPGPVKRKAENKGKGQEMSLREKLMVKKRKLAEDLKKMSEAEVTTVLPEKANETPMKLSSEAKPFAPMSETKVTALTESSSEKNPLSDTGKGVAEQTDGIADEETNANDADKLPVIVSPAKKPASLLEEIKSTASPKSSAKTEKTVKADQQKEEASSKPVTSEVVVKEDIEDTKPKASTAIVASSTSFGASKRFGSGAPFGSTGFGKAAGSSLTFGSATKSAGFGTKPTVEAKPIAFGSAEPIGEDSAPGFGSAKPVGGDSAPAFGSAKPPSGDSAPAFGSGKAPTFGSSGTFLNIKPPGASSSPFTFGKSATIKLPTPSKGTAAPPSFAGSAFGAPGAFGAFGKQSTGSSDFGAASQAKPLFESSLKRSSPDDKEESDVKQSRTKTENEGSQGGD